MPVVNRNLVLAIIIVSYLIIVIDISIVITALPEIQEELRLSTADLSWVQNAYMLALGGLLLLGARAGDIFGRRLMFTVGLAIFTLASLVVGFAQDAVVLIASRVAQGAGASIVAPSALALLQSNFPEGTQRTRAVAYYAAAAGVGSSLGLVLGGILADTVSWRAGFFVNVPIGMILIATTLRTVAETDRHPGKLDVVGAILSTIGMTGIVFGLVRSTSTGWLDLYTSGSLAGGIVLVICFVFNEAVAGQPIMPLRLFADRERVGAYSGRLMFMGANAGFWFFSTQLLQGVLGYSPMSTGIAFLVATLPNFAFAVMVPTLTRRFGNAQLMAGGLVAGLVGMAWLSRAGADANFWLDIALPMVLVGISQGTVHGPLTSSGIARVAPADAGAASGVVNVSHQLGGSLGLALLVTLFSSAHGAVPGADEKAAMVSGLNLALGGGAALMLVSTCLVMALIVVPGRRRSVAGQAS